MGRGRGKLSCFWGRMGSQVQSISCSDGPLWIILVKDHQLVLFVFGVYGRGGFYQWLGLFW